MAKLALTPLSLRRGESQPVAHRGRVGPPHPTTARPSRNTERGGPADRSEPLENLRRPRTPWGAGRLPRPLSQPARLRARATGGAAPSSAPVAATRCRGVWESGLCPLRAGPVLSQGIFPEEVKGTRTRTPGHGMEGVPPRSHVCCSLLSSQEWRFFCLSIYISKTMSLEIAHWCAVHAAFFLLNHFSYF